jgi:hypothetical protein
MLKDTRGRSDSIVLGTLTTWTPIASRSREPIRRVRQEKDGATRVVLYAHAWAPVDGAPLSIDAACELADDGLLVKAIRYAGDQEHVVVRRVKALTA